VSPGGNSVIRFSKVAAADPYVDVSPHLICWCAANGCVSMHLNYGVLQMAVLVCCDVLPTTVMTLPAAQGGLTASFQIYASHIRDWGVSVPEMGPPVAALGVTALLAAGARLFEHATTQEEYVSLSLCVFVHPSVQSVDC